jgi:hypothetical protein
VGLVVLAYAGRFFRWVYYLKLLKVSVPLGINAAIFGLDPRSAVLPRV